MYNNKAKQNLCVSSTKICWASGQSWEKKREREADCTLVLSLQIRTPSGIQNNKKLRATWVLPIPAQL